jgi:hypothetical protein
MVGTRHWYRAAEAARRLGWAGRPDAREAVRQSIAGGGVPGLLPDERTDREVPLTVLATGAQRSIS